MVDLQEKQCTIVKRNGMFVPFDRNRIIQALEAAFRDTRRIDDHTPLPEDLESSIRSITQQVVKEVVQKNLRWTGRYCGAYPRYGRKSALH